MMKTKEFRITDKFPGLNQLTANQKIRLMEWIGERTTGGNQNYNADTLIWGFANEVLTWKKETEENQKKTKKK